MNIQLGTLEILSANDHSELLADVVTEALLKLHSSDTVGVAQINPEFSDTAGFCEQYGVRMDQSANCVVLRAKQGDKSFFAVCLILGSCRADINGVVRKTLDAKKVSFAPMEQAVSESSMEFGAITPIGIPLEWPLLIDKAVVDTEYVVIGSGVRVSKLVVPGSLLAALPHAMVIDGLGQVKK